MTILVTQTLDSTDENDVIAAFHSDLSLALEIGDAIRQDRATTQAQLVRDAFEFVECRSRKMLRKFPLMKTKYIYSELA